VHHDYIEEVLSTQKIGYNYNTLFQVASINYLNSDADRSYELHGFLQLGIPMYTASKYIYPHKREKDYRGPTLFERIFNSDKVYNPAKSYLRTLISSGFDLNRKYVYIDGEQYDSAYETLVEVYLSKLDSDKRN